MSAQATEGAPTIPLIAPELVWPTTTIPVCFEQVTPENLEARGWVQGRTVNVTQFHSRLVEGDSIVEVTVKVESAADSLLWHAKANCAECALQAQDATFAELEVSGVDVIRVDPQIFAE